jgi:hypothetical protein
MASVQGIVYGHADCWGLPFDFYSSVGGGTLVTGQTIVMQTGKLVFHLAATLAAETVILPLNPPDGADVEISQSVNTFNITGLTVTANTGDVIVGTAAASLNSGITVRYKYSLNGDITKGVLPRTWVRVL